MTRTELLAKYAAGERNFNKVDLSGENLSNTDLRGIKLRSATLIGTDFTGTNLSNADLEGALLLDALLIRANLTAVDFRHADLTNANLKGSTTAGCDFTDAYLRDILLPIDKNKTYTSQEVRELFIELERERNRFCAEDACEIIPLEEWLIEHGL